MTRDKIVAERSTGMLMFGSPPEKLEILAGEVHLWRTHLRLAPGPVEELARTLSADEHERAARFHFQKDRLRFIIAHGFLRSVLSLCTGISPDRLRFSTNAFGKPFLTEHGGGPPLYFNLTHSGEVALIACSKVELLGVDTEKIRPEVMNEGIAERFFAPPETRSLLSLPPELQADAFFRCWTRKEAFVKAQGAGLSIPLDKFEVTLRPDEPPALLGLQHQPEEAKQWSICDVSPEPGYAGAVAVRTSTPKLHLWHWGYDSRNS